MIILATGSKYRIKVMKKLKIPFVAEKSNIDESILPRKDPRSLVLNLARLKAEDVGKRHRKGIIIGIDSIAFFNGKILEKPKTYKEAAKRLKALSGKEHYTYTGVYLLNKDKNKFLSKVVKTKIVMRELNDKEIKKYIRLDKNILDYCLGYNPEGEISASFVKKINGSYNNLLNGMPIEVIVELLRKIE